MYLTIVALGLAVAAAATDGDRQAVICADASFSRAVEQGRSDEFLGWLDDDARFFSRNRMKRGADDILRAWAMYFEPGGPKLRWRPQFVEILANGRLAITRGPYRYIGRGENGTAVESWGTYNSVWRKLPDGSWKILYDSGGSPSPAGGPSDAEREILASEPECP